MKITRIVCMVMAFAIAGSLVRCFGLTEKTQKFFNIKNKKNSEKALSTIFTVDLAKYNTKEDIKKDIEFSTNSDENNALNDIKNFVLKLDDSFEQNKIQLQSLEGLPYAVQAVVCMTCKLAHTWVKKNYHAIITTSCFADHDSATYIFPDSKLSLLHYTLMEKRELDKDRNIITTLLAPGMNAGFDGLNEASIKKLVAVAGGATGIPGNLSFGKGLNGKTVWHYLALRGGGSKCAWDYFLDPKNAPDNIDMKDNNGKTPLAWAIEGYTIVENAETEAEKEYKERHLYIIGKFISWKAKMSLLKNMTYFIYSKMNCWNKLFRIAGDDGNGKKFDGKTLLYWAITNKDKDAIIDLLSRGVKCIDISDALLKDLVTSLGIDTLFIGHYDHGTKNISDSNCYNLLHYACLNQDYELAKRLLALGAKPEVTMGNIKNASMEVENENPKSRTERTSLYAALFTNDLKSINRNLVTLLLEKGDLIQDVGPDLYEKLKKVIAKKPDGFDASDEADLLIKAVLYNYVNSAKYLLGIQVGKFASVKEINPNIEDQDKRTPIFYTAFNKSLDIASALIKKGADLNHKDKDENVPLDSAIQQKNALLIELLLKNNANLSLISSKSFDDLITLIGGIDALVAGKTLLDHILEYDYKGFDISLKKSALKHLIAKSVDFSKLAEDVSKSLWNSEEEESIGKNFLAFKAAQCGNTEIIKLFCKQKTLKEKINNGYKKPEETLLYFAAQNGSIVNVEILLNNGADPRLFDYSDFDKEIVKLLQKKVDELKPKGEAHSIVKCII